MPGGHKPSQASPPVSVAVVDDEPDLLFLIEKILGDGGFEIVGTATDGLAAIELVRVTQPQVVVLDLHMPKMRGEQALPALVTRAPRTMVAICSGQLHATRAHDLLSLGAFAAYRKGDLHQLPALLREDLARFEAVLSGKADVPAWFRRYEEL